MCRKREIGEHRGRTVGESGSDLERRRSGKAAGPGAIPVEVWRCLRGSSGLLSRLTAKQ